MALNEEDPKLTQLELAYSDFKTLLQTSAKMEESLGKMDKKFDLIDETLSTASRRVIPLQSLAMATKALDTRINRAVTPALSLMKASNSPSLSRTSSLNYHPTYQPRQHPERGSRHFSTMWTVLISSMLLLIRSVERESR